MSRFNKKEWCSGATREKLPHFWFTMDGMRVDVVANAYLKAQPVKTNCLFDLYYL